MTTLTTNYREEFANWIDTLVSEKGFNRGIRLKQRVAPELITFRLTL